MNTTINPRPCRSCGGDITHSKTSKFCSPCVFKTVRRSPFINRYNLPWRMLCEYLHGEGGFGAARKARGNTWKLKQRMTYRAARKFLQTFHIP